MILLRKNAAPNGLKDYRPISLMHSFGKLFAKCLARRLAPRLTHLIARNQSAFIKDRSIHDNFKSVQLACRWLFNKKCASVLLKIDIAKAFDSVAWPFLLEVLQHIGFPRRWSNWISIMLSTASTKVMLNGRPGRRIAHARGLRQGDPISPMLFVITMEALNSLIIRADRHRTLTPLPGPAACTRASLYADDLVVIIKPTQQDLHCLNSILQLFAGASGLVTNVEKCVATPIRCTEDMIDTVKQVFPCVVAPFPCKYLGIPLSLRRLRRAEELVLVDAVAARIPTWKSGLLTHAGRVLLAKVTLSTIPVHLSIACCLSSWAIAQIDKRRRAFLWAGAETVAGGKCKLSWPVVCRPSDIGGLGVLDLRFFGFALRLRWEWLARAEPQRCWATLPSTPEKSVAAMAAVSMSVAVGDGTTSRLWTDDWAPVGRLCAFAPKLFAAVSARGRKRCVRDGLLNNTWARDITGALTVQVLLQYLRVWRVLHGVTLNPLQADRFIWKWTPDGNYTASSAYRAFFVGSSSLLGAKELWKVKAPPKVKFFFWLALHGRLWTADRRRRHGLQDSDECNLCAQEAETRAHLFKSCVMARQLWQLLLQPLGLLPLAPNVEDCSLADWWLRARGHLLSEDRPAFDSMVLLVTWFLWKERNARVFRGLASDLVAIAKAVVSEGELWCQAGFKPLSAFVVPWSLFVLSL